MVETGEHDSVKELAVDFLHLWRHGGNLRPQDRLQPRPGRLHARLLHCPLAFIPNNAIVGGSARIATGAALFKRVQPASRGIVVANIGDGSAGLRPGATRRMNFASMDQFDKLWEEGFKGGLPMLFNIFNNQYGMGGQTKGETMGYDVLARLGAGFAANQMHAERVDGYNPLAVIEAVRPQEGSPAQGSGPGAARCGHLPLCGPQPVRRFQLPHARKKSPPGRPSIRWSPIARSSWKPALPPKPSATPSPNT